MHTYVAFLRGINVGGKGLIKMAELKDCLGERGFTNVRTFIQSGNVIFQSESADTEALASAISGAINESFNLTVPVVLFGAHKWEKVISTAPAWWGKDETWKHNILILTEPCDSDEAVASIGTLKPDIEHIAAGKGVIYQSISREHFSRARSGKLASLPLYKKLTVRNYNTATKILALFVFKS